MGVAGGRRGGRPHQSRHPGRFAHRAPQRATYRADTLWRAPAATSKHPSGRASPPHHCLHVEGSAGRLTIPGPGSSMSPCPSRPLRSLPEVDGGALRASEGSKGLVEAGRGQAEGAPPHRRLARRPDMGPLEESPGRGGRTEAGGRRVGPTPRGNLAGTRVTDGTGKARHELPGREFRVLQLAAVTGRSAGYNRKRPNLSAIVAGRVCS